MTRLIAWVLRRWVVCKEYLSERGVQNPQGVILLALAVEKSNTDQRGVNCTDATYLGEQMLGDPYVFEIDHAGDDFVLGDGDLVG